MSENPFDKFTRKKKEAPPVKPEKKVPSFADQYINAVPPGYWNISPNTLYFPQMSSLYNKTFNYPGMPTTRNNKMSPGLKELCVNITPDMLEVGMVIRTNAVVQDRALENHPGYFRRLGSYVEGTIMTVSGNDIIELKDVTAEKGNDKIGLWQVAISNRAGAYLPQEVTWIEIVSPDSAKGKSKSKKKEDKPVTIDSVILAQDKKDQVLKAIGQIEHTEKIFEEWGFGEVFEKGTAVSLLFYGAPGTGKTLMGQAIADHLGLKLKIVQSGEIWSSEPGQAERNIKAFFEGTKGKTLLLFDECDSLIADRNEVGMILAAEINALLTCLERYDGVVVFTTNRLGRMDPAFERRVSAKIEFPFPDHAQRLQIWKRLMPAKAPIDKDVDFEKLADYPMAGGNIKNVVLNAARSAAYDKKKAIHMIDFQGAVESEMESLKSFESAYANQNKLPRERGMGSGMSRQAGGIQVDRSPGQKLDRETRVDMIEEKMKEAVQEEDGQIN